jgi:hypothetical protein
LAWSRLNELAWTVTYGQGDQIGRLLSLVIFSNITEVALIVGIFKKSYVFISLKKFGRFFHKPQSGTDVMIFKIFSPKNSAKKMAFLTRNKAKF